MGKAVLSLGCALALAGTACAAGYGVKYIATGWDIGRATAEQVLARADQFDELPIAGIALGLSAEQDGASLDAGYAWNDPAWRYESFAKYPALFRQIVAHKSLRESFLACGLSARRTEGRKAVLGGRSPRVALDDDAAWARLANNYGVLARLAREGGLRGLLVDNEDYHGTGQFDLKPGDGDWKSANAKMRARGRQLFKAVFDAYPDVRLLFFWAFSNARTQASAPDPAAALERSGRLFPAFLNGMLDVMPPEAVFIDGDEDAYTFRAEDGAFDRAFVTLMRDALAFVAPENRAKYRAQMRNSFGLYLDQYVGAKYRTRAGKRGVPNNWYRPPVDGSRDRAFLEDLAAATRAADEYVWVYGERFSFIDWEGDLNGTMRPWNAFLPRQTWNERLGLDAKLRLCRDPQEALAHELARRAPRPQEGNLIARVAGETPAAARSHTVIVSELVTNRNHFAVTVERRGETAAPVARWQRGRDWNWEPHGARKVELRPVATNGGWTTYTALLRAPVAATRVQLQFGDDGEMRNAAMYLVDPPPREKFHLGYQMDLGRIPAPPLAELKARADTLAALGYDQFQLYMECSFAYKGHEKAWSRRRTLTAGELTELSAYCRGKGIDLIPSQNSFAHMGTWFETPDYLALAECPNGAVIDTPRIRKRRGPVTLTASDGATLKFLGGLFDQLLPCAESRYLNIGCDEVFDLLDVNCRSAARVKREGYARVYWNHVLDVAKLAYVRQREAMFWADAIFEYPELQREIGRNMIALVYGYTPGGDDRFDEKCASLAAHEVRFYLCPGTQGWKVKKSVDERRALARANVREAYAAAVAHGAEGLMVCDWGDDAYPQPMDYSRPVLEYAAGLVKGRK